MYLSNVKDNTEARIASLVKKYEEVTSKAPASRGRVNYAFRISGILKFLERK